MHNFILYRIEFEAAGVLEVSLSTAIEHTSIQFLIGSYLHFCFRWTNGAIHICIVLYCAALMYP